MTNTEKKERQRMVLAMEYIARQVNDEEVFERWLIMGVADGDIPYGSFDIDDVDDYYTESDNFRELMDTFLILMRDAKVSGGLFCGSIVTDAG